MQAFRTVLSLACLLGVAACASSTPQLDTHFGDAVNAAVARQTLDPGASKRTVDASGIDGAAADESMHRYIDTFKAPPPTFVIINSGASAAPAGQ
jgi:hypothetical protein